MREYSRTDRVNQLLLEEISRLIRREIKDPRVRRVTVTEVDTTPDLMHATVHVRTLGNEPPAEEAVVGLESAEGFIRRALGRELHLYRIPELRFEIDRTLEKVQRIESLLEEARESREEDVEGED